MTASGMTGGEEKETAMPSVGRPQGGACVEGTMTLKGGSTPRGPIPCDDRWAPKPPTKANLFTRQPMEDPFADEA